MKIFRTQLIKEIDEHTIKNEPVASFDLMERAAEQVFKWFIKTFDRTRKILILAGPGNNGGDGLALARLLSFNRYSVEVFFIKTSGKTSADWNHNYNRLKEETTVAFNSVDDIEHFPFINSDEIVIDAIFGSGLTRPADDLVQKVIKKLNHSEATVVSIDIPSGLFGEDNSSNDPESIVCADFTLSFEFPKLCFMFGENARYVGDWIVLPIGLSKTAIRNTKTPYFLLDKDFIAPLLKKRQKFDHKGKYGHGLLIAGSFGKIGSVVLGAKAALRTGIGLITCHIPKCGYQIIQTAVPEAMTDPDNNEDIISSIVTIDTFSAAAIGPGIGTDPITQKFLHNLLLGCKIPLVIDADGINILGLSKDWLSDLPNDTILTPHPKEFERIAGKTDIGYATLEKQIELASRYKSIIVLKGAYSSVVTPDGKVFFNSTGNPGMATAGSGDVLTGMILSLLAQGYSPENASIIGVFLHGLAGDIAAEKHGFESLIATDIIENIGNAFHIIKDQGN